MQLPNGAVLSDAVLSDAVLSDAVAEEGELTDGEKMATTGSAGRLALVALCGVLTSPIASANIRAPRSEPSGPSGPLLLPTDGTRAQGLVVESESLSLRCDLQQCRVQATYNLRSDRARVLKTELFLGSPDPVVATLAGTETRLVSTPRLYRDDASAPTAELVGSPTVVEVKERVREVSYGDEPEVYLAPLALPLRAGLNAISLVYSQPLGLSEVGHGYFSDGDLLRTADYHVWPLKRWTLAPDFALAVEVLFERSVSAWWVRWLFSDDEVRCSAGEADRGWQREELDEGRRLRLQQRFEGAELPDVVACVMGAL